MRLDHDEECLTDTRFHFMWHRYTGKWFPYHASTTLDEALRMIETDPTLQPPHGDQIKGRTHHLIGTRMWQVSTAILLAIWRF